VGAGFSRLCVVRAVVQRVSHALVRVGDRVVGQIGTGLVVLLGVAKDDGPDDVRYVAGKIRDARVFAGGAARIRACPV